MAPTLKTQRLVLRPFRAEDASAVQAQCGNWNVARMLTRVSHPYTLDLADEWIASHESFRQSGEEFVFCLDLKGEAIDPIGLRRTRDREFNLGYWLSESWWGRGFATEAARRVVRFAVDELGAERLTAGHFADNPASGRVLEKCGFRYTGSGMMVGAARGEVAPHRNFEMFLGESEGQAGTS